MTWAKGHPSAAPAVQGETQLALEGRWRVVVLNDPVNLMSYVTYVFMSYFGYPKKHAEKLMMDVHTKGKAAVSHGTREEMERDTQAMQGFGLWATFEKDG